MVFSQKEKDKLVSLLKNVNVKLVFSQKEDDKLVSLLGKQSLFSPENTQEKCSTLSTKLSVSSSSVNNLGDLNSTSCCGVKCEITVKLCLQSQLNNLFYGLFKWLLRT